MHQHIIKILTLILCSLFVVTCSTSNSKRVSESRVTELSIQFQEQYDAGLYKQAYETALKTIELTENSKFPEAYILAFLQAQKAGKYFKENPEKEFLLAVHNAQLKETNLVRRAFLISVLSNEILSFSRFSGMESLPLEKPSLENIEQWKTQNFEEKFLEINQFFLDNKALLQNEKMEQFPELLEQGNVINFTSVFENLLFTETLHLSNFIQQNGLLSNLNDSLAAPLFGSAVDFIDFNSAPFVSTIEAKLIENFKTLETLALEQKEIGNQRFLFLQRAQNTWPLDNTYKQLTFKNALFTFEDTNQPIDAFIQIAKVNFLKNHALPSIKKSDFDRRNDTYQEILRLCSLAEGVENSAGFQAKIFKKYILQHSISLESFGAAIPNQPLMIQYSVKNVDSLSAYFVRNAQFNGKVIDSLPAFPLPLPPNAYESVSAVNLINLPKTPGKYTLKIESFKQGDKLMTTLPLQVSSLNFQRIYLDEQNNQFLITNASTGIPEQNVEVSLYQSNWQSKTNFELLEKSKSKNDGIVTFAIEKPINNASLLLVKGKDSVMASLGYLGAFQPQTQEGERKRVFFFTDRAIYQPGEIIQFKALVASYPLNGEQGSMLANEKIDIKLQSPDFKTLENRIFTTNNMGSIEGKFTIPKNTVSGTYRLSTNFGEKIIKVEPFTAPVAELKVTLPQEIIKPGERFTITGNAKRLTGEPILQGTINFTITEYSFYRFGEKLVDSGSLRTDEKGNFALTLTAAEAGIHNQIVLQFVDKSGNTTQYQVSYSVPQSGVNLNLQAQPQYFVSQEKALAVQARNLFNLSVQTEIDFELKKVVEHKTIPASITPQFNYTKFTLEHSFIPVLQGANRTVKDREPLVLNVTEAGVYSLTYGLKGQEKTDLKFTIVDPKAQKNSILEEPLYSFFTPDSGAIILGSNLTGARAFVQFSSEGGYRKFESFTLSKEQIAIPLIRYYIPKPGERMRISIVGLHNGFSLPLGGGFGSALNHFITGKEDTFTLDWAYNGFRENVTPGDTVNFTLTLKSSNKTEPFELAATLFNAGLNQIAPNPWKAIPTHQKRFISLPTLNTSPLYHSRNGNTKFKDEPYEENKNPLRLPRFIWQEEKNTILYRLPLIAVPREAKLAVMAAYEVSEDLEEVEILDIEVSENETQVRTQFPETVFFYPNIRTRTPNQFTLEYILPDNLTQWQMNLLAHSKNAASFTDTKLINSTLPVFIEMGRPLFFRENDQIKLPFTLYLGSAVTRDPIVQIKITDALSGADVTSKWLREPATKTLGKSEEVQQCAFNLKPQLGSGHINIEIKALAGKHSDAERRTFTVLPEKIMVIEGFPFLAEPNAINQINYDKLQQEGNNPRYETSFLQFSYTGNPFWEVLTALPAIQGSESGLLLDATAKLNLLLTLKNTLSKNPTIALELERVKMALPPQQLEKLKGNQKAKVLFLSQTPWQQTALNDRENFALLAGLMQPNEINYIQAQLEQFIADSQFEDGSWPWIAKGTSSAFITEEITLNLLINQQLGVGENIPFSADVQKAVNSALAFLLNRWKNNNQPEFISRNALDWLTLDAKNPKLFGADFKTFIQPWKTKIEENYLKAPLEKQAQLLPYFYYTGERTKGLTLANSIKDIAETSGSITYWNSAKRIKNSSEYVNLLTHLAQGLGYFFPNEPWVQGITNEILLQKRSNLWGNSLTTARVCSFLLKDYEAMPLEKITPQLVWGKDYIAPIPGTLNARKNITNPVNPQLYSAASIENLSESISWGHILWGYQTTSEHIKKSAENSDLTLTRKLLVSREINGVQRLVEPQNFTFKQGERLWIRLTINNKKPGSHIFINEYFPAGLQYESGLSGNKFQDGARYYLAADADKISLFFEQLPAGNFTITMPFYTAFSGNFSGGFAQLQNFYAPEFTSLSEGIPAVTVE
ncbi:MAG: MG2 domain-containing protein [Luteibaculaceae bacterium]